MDIDFVVLWVDGNDPQWRAEKEAYSPGKIDDSNSVYRFRDWGLMKYWFRAIETYTPWFRKIHFVTWGHLPSFLNVDNPKLHIVKHEDYMPLDALPTFNANALELNLFRIEGLAEHFVYFNDDTFISRKMEKSDFFHSVSGLPVSQFCELPCWFVGNLGVWQMLFANSLGIINKQFPKGDISLRSYFGKYLNGRYPIQDNIRTIAMKALFPGYYVGFRTFHSPVPYRKSIFEEMWEREPETLKNTTMHKFRNANDVSQILPFWWQMISGQFFPGRVDNVVEDILPETIDRICFEIENRSQDMLCINDPSDKIDFEYLSARIRESFEKALPGRSSFEKEMDV